MTAMQWITLLGAIGLFLCGMNLLGTAMEKTAGPGMEAQLEKMAGRKRGSMFLGMGVAAAVQSASSTSVMVIGFINSGGMQLAQGVMVMMGANIGATLLGHLLRLGDISAGVWYAFLRPAVLAPVCIALGAAVRLAGRKPIVKQIASLITGVGILLAGMEAIEVAWAPFVGQMSPAGMAIATHPAVCFVTGVAATALLRSSSACVGILQAICASGYVPFPAAAALVVGVNVGRFVPVLVDSAGMGRKAIRAVLVNVAMSLITAVLFLLVLLVWTWTGHGFPADTVSRGRVADMNTLFNLAAALMALPLCGMLVKLSGKMMPRREQTLEDGGLSVLDPNFLQTPAVALEQCRKVVISMGVRARENVDLAAVALKRPTGGLFSRITDNERFLDRAESRTGEYLVQITSRGLDREKTRAATQITYAVGDFERIGDYAVNISEVAQYKQAHHIDFSPAGWQEMTLLFAAVGEIIDMTLRAFSESSANWAECVEPLEETIDSMVEVMKQRHLERLQRGECSISRDISFSEILAAVERISDHCSNIAVNVLKNISDSEDFDIHARLDQLHNGGNQHYNELHHAYMEKYHSKL